MTIEKGDGRLQQPRQSLFTELDDLVLREVEALDQSVQRPQPGSKAGSRQPTAARPEQENVVRAEDWRRRPSRAEPPSEQAQVLPLGKRQPTQRGNRLFAEEDEAFIEQSVLWLKGRPNADQLLEEIWRLVVPFDEEAELAVAEEDPGTASPPHTHDAPGPASEGDNGAADEDHENRREPN